MDVINAKEINFEHLSGKNIRIALVDSGIDQRHPKIGTVEGGVAIGITNGEICWKSDYCDVSGHGTACAGIVRRIAPLSRLYSIKVFDASLLAPPRVLTAAITWAIENDINIINLSLGTTDVAAKESIEKVCNSANEAGIIIVASEHNDGIESYPAVFPSVIGVTGGDIFGKYDYHYRKNHIIECVARGGEQRVCWINQQEIVTKGTSYSAPHITGIVALILENDPQIGLDEVRETLARNASNTMEHGKTGTTAVLRGAYNVSTPTNKVPSSSAITATSCREHSWIESATLFPFNKEMHSLVRFRDMLGFTISGIADPIGKGLVGKDAGEVVGLDSTGIQITHSLNKVMLKSNTLILGHVGEISRIQKRDLLQEIVETALYSDLHIFSLSKIDAKKYNTLFKLAAERGRILAFPDIDENEVYSCLNMRNDYPVVDVPVVGVYGTSSHQGKFTLQLILRKMLLGLGYRIGQIGTEPQSPLFGMDVCIPLGYDSPIYQIPLQVLVPYLDFKMKQLCYKIKPDIILTGSQSGTIPYDASTLNTYNPTSMPFLIGTNPDACVLVVNNIDSDEYISDTINVIKGMSKAPVILLGLYDREKSLRALHGRNIMGHRKLGTDEIAEKIRQLETTFGIPSIQITDTNDHKKLIDCILGHFK